MQIYYNTNHLSGDELKQAVTNADAQDCAILLIFQNTGKAYSPSQIMGMCHRAGKNWPLTSIRRSITNLTKSNNLVKTGVQVIGIYGKPEYKWMIKKI